jgi:KipI family sensor histidine kinase inhibitor
MARAQAEPPRIAPAGDQALVLEFDASISRAVNQRVRDVEETLTEAAWPEIISMVPSYRSLLVYYDPVAICFEELSQRLLLTLSETKSATAKRPKRWTLPVRYGAGSDSDLDDLAKKLSLASDDVIRLHSETEYMVYMIGFSPGFAYLGELPTALEVPRKIVPAPLVPSNTIQVGGQQTAVTSVPMPSGWYVVGLTPVRMYQPDRSKPFLLDGGDLVRFRPITLAEFAEISENAARGTYEPSCEWVR